MRLLVVGLNHRTAPLAVREALAFSTERLPEAVSRFRAAYPSAELVILSTCNRVELYLGRPVGGAPSLDQLAAFLSAFHGVPLNHFAAHLYHHEDRAMVEHLFRVAASLDSMVVGETQILAQVKQAYQSAAVLGAIGQEEAHGVFHTLFQRALAAAKAVHEQTNLAGGRVSIASVAVDLARSVFDRFDDKTVLCIGAGKMSALVLRHLHELGPRQICIANRSYDRAQRLAADFGARPVEFDRLDELLVEADIVLTSTGSPEPIITGPRFRQLLKPRRYRPVVMVDIAVPRDVDPAVGQLNNVYLYNIDDLEQVAAANRDKRSAQIESSQSLLQQHVEEFIAWYAARDVGPLVKALYAQINGIAQAEMAHYLARHPDLDEAQRRDLERLVHRLVGKMLHGPVTQITHQSHVTARPMLASAIKKLFSLRDPGEWPERPPAASAETPHPAPGSAADRD